MRIALTKRNVVLLFFLGIIILCSAVNLIATNAIFIFTDNIYEGVTVGNVSVGGLSIEEGSNKISAAFNDQISRSNIVVGYQNERWVIAPQDIELSINAYDLARQAHNVGRTGNIVTIIQERYLAVNGGYRIPFTKSYNSDLLHAILTTIAKSVDRLPQNASILYKDNNVTIIPEIWGQQVDLSQSLANFANQLNNNLHFNCELTITKVSPQVTSQDFTDIDSLLGVYTTQFNPNNIKRYKNVEIASNHINDILVRAGEVFSFNQSVGLRIPEYGYEEASVMVDGKLLVDWGGGVCQVSSTLYNAVLLADMEIEERVSHFQPPGYVPLGQDATVADNLIDFKFKNNSLHNIYITSEINNGQIIVSIYGKSNINRADIHIESTTKNIGYATVIRQDASLPQGKEVLESAGQQGFEVATYRVKLMNGQEVSRETLSSDFFKPEDRVIRIGTKLLAQQTSK